MTAAAAPEVQRRCPFCGEPAAQRECLHCMRDTTAPRRPCPSCSRMMPLGDPKCGRCGAVVTSELRWKVPLIIGIFVLAIALSVALQLA